MLQLPLGPYGILAVILAGYLILCVVIDELAMVLLTLHIAFPTISSLGFDPTWFGVIIVMTVKRSLIHPHVRTDVFVINSPAPNVSVGEICRGVGAFIVADIVRLIIL